MKRALGSPLRELRVRTQLLSQCPPIPTKYVITSGGLSSAPKTERKYYQPFGMTIYGPLRTLARTDDKLPPKGRQSLGTLKLEG
ncbi:hypothetical protein CC2G_008915 [Coprinopsis cinerea AmutBmut pab1-1]|nr:hypothetical protein CC2G_008915 [Coprinopsis cinerea AmutBmut pab1-1]